MPKPHDYRPASYSDLLYGQAQNILNYHRCVKCGKHFDEDNVKTELGWAETQISGMCETCYDKLFEEK